ncbi:hypothetical protein [Marilutibacter maris]|nr:hypothetical protein [Lysobacter maris]
MNLCPLCSGSNTVRDGKVVRVPLVMMDSMQREVAAHFAASTSDASATGDNGYAASVAALDHRTRSLSSQQVDADRAQARADHEEWKRQQASGSHVATSTSHPANDGCAALDAYYAQVIAENKASGERRLAALDAERAKVQACADSFREENRRRGLSEDPRTAAYDAMVAGLQWKPRTTTSGG